MRCLQNAIKHLNAKQHPQTHMLLSGQTIDRGENEKPDFVTQCTIGDKTVLCGIEHFLTDRLAVPHPTQPDRKTNSIGRYFDKTYNEKRKEYQRQNKLQRLMKVITKDSKYVVATVCEQLICLFTTPRKMLLKSFYTALRHHALQKEREYETALNRINADCDKYYILLVELRLRSSNLRLHNNGHCTKLEKLTQYSLPDDIVSELIAQQESLSKFDYIVMCVYHDSEQETHNVIAFKPCKIEKQLNEANVLIYRYIGEDSYTSEPSSITYYQLSTMKTVKEHIKALKKIAAHMCKKEHQIYQSEMIKEIQDCKEQNIPYATICGARRKTNSLWR